MSMVLQWNSRRISAQAVTAISFSPRQDSSRPAKPAIVAFRAAWEAANRA